MQPPRNNHQVSKTHLHKRETGIDCWPLITEVMVTNNENDQADRAISTGKLHTLPRFHTQPINVVVFDDSQGILVFRLVSRLDAFSGYLFRI